MSNGMGGASRHLCRSWLLLATLLTTTAAHAQGLRDWDPPVPTFRATTSLLTIDLVVTDKDGRHVTDLTIDDFEVTHSGRPVSLQQAAYVDTIAATAPEAPERRAEAGDSPAPTSPRRAPLLTSALRAERRAPSRTIAFVVDDLGISFEGMYLARRALRRYVETQMEPGDLVAIVRTAGGVGALQQFTTDRRLLDAAIGRLQWTPISRSAIGGFATAQPNLPGGNVAGEVSEIRDRVLAVSSFASIQFIATGIQQLPGRKAIVLFSEHFGDIFTDRGESGQIWRALARMLDHANRAGVVIHTINPLGLQTGGPTAEDDPRLFDYAPPGLGVTAGPSEPQEDAIREVGISRRRDLVRSQQSLQFIAEQTGGLSFVQTNDLNAAIQRALNDQRGYYLLGYPAPERGGTSGWDQNRVKVRVKRRPDLQVRARQGFFGPADPAGQKNDFSGDPLVRAALSPFAGGAIEVRLTSLFAYDEEGGSFIRSLLFIDPNGVTFTPAADGRREARIEVLQAAVGDNGLIGIQWRRVLTLSLTDDQLAMVRREGITYSARLPVKKAGAYQVRTAVQDIASTAVGSASQFVEVPPVGKGKVALSGVLLQAKADDATAAETAASGLDIAEQVDRIEDVLGRPSLRIFSPGSDVVYAYQVYDGLDRQRAEPLETRTALLRDGRVVYESPSTPLRTEQKTSNVRVVPIAGLLSLGDDVPPGRYTLQVSVGSGKRRATQFAELEVRK